MKLTNHKKLKLSILSVLLILAGALCFYAAFSKKSVDKITFAAYAYMPDYDRFTGELVKEWKAEGHTTELEIIPWNCYKEDMPEADLYFYDAICYESFLSKNSFAPLETTDTSVFFDWAVPESADGSLYAVPLLLCSRFLIYDKDSETLTKARSVFDLTEDSGFSLEDDCFYLYLEAALADSGKTGAFTPDTKILDEAGLETLYSLAETAGKGNVPADAELLDLLEGGRLEGIIAFSEDLNRLEDAEERYGIKLLSRSTRNPSRSPFYADLLSVDKDATGAKKELAEELIALLCSSDFLYDFIENDGDCLYTIPANKQLLERLAAENDIFRTLSDTIADRDPVLILYGPTFFEDRDKLELILSEELRKIFEQTEKEAA